MTKAQLKIKAMLFKEFLIKHWYDEGTSFDEWDTVVRVGDFMEGKYDPDWLDKDKFNQELKELIGE